MLVNVNCDESQNRQAMLSIGRPVQDGDAGVYVG